MASAPVFKQRPDAQQQKGNPFTKEEMTAALTLLSLAQSRPQRSCVAAKKTQQQAPQRSQRPRRSTADYTPGIYTGQD
jgi:hypothetical protein